MQLEALGTAAPVGALRVGAFLAFLALAILFFELFLGGTLPDLAKDLLLVVLRLLFKFLVRVKR